MRRQQEEVNTRSTSNSKSRKVKSLIGATLLAIMGPGPSQEIQRVGGTDRAKPMTKFIERGAFNPLVKTEGTLR